MAALVAGQYVKAIDGDQIDTDGVKRYVALLSQTGTDAPVATVLQNSLGGTLVWSRDGAGQYSGTLAGAFPANKVSNFSKRSNASAFDEVGRQIRGYRGSDNVFIVETGQPGDGNSDDWLLGDYIEILVFP